MRRLMLLCCLLLALMFSGVVQAQPQPLGFGELIPFSFDVQTSSVRFDIQIANPETIYVAVSGENLPDFEIAIFSPTGTEIVRSYVEVIPPVEVTRAGTYRIEVLRTDEQTDPRDLEITADRAVVERIKPDGTYTGRLERAGDVVFFNYFGQAQQLFGYSVQGSGVSFTMLQADGNPIIATGFEDYVGSPLNETPTEGAYVAYVQTNNPDGTDYQLSLSPVEVISLTPDAPVSGRFVEGRAAVLSFETLQDDVWSIETTLNIPYSSQMYLLNANDLSRNIAADYGSGPMGAPRLSPFVTPLSGTYYLVLMGDDNESSTATFEYTISLTPAELNILSAGAPIEGELLADAGAVNYTYIGSAGETIRVTLSMQSAEGHPALVIMSPEDYLADLIARNQAEFTLTITLPVSGRYTIVVDNDDYESTTMRYILRLDYP